MDGVRSADRMWGCYTKQLAVKRSVGIRNVGYGKDGEACTPTAFVPCGQGMHRDNFVFVP